MKEPADREQHGFQVTADIDGSDFLAQVLGLWH